MKNPILKKTNIGLLAAAAVAFLSAPVYADEYDQATKITVNEPVRFPSLTLQPGNYQLRLVEHSGNRNVVQVRDETGKGLALILAMPNYQLVPKDKTVLTYWETPAGQPRAVRAWFFPGNNYGQEFAYPKSEAEAIGNYAHATVPVIPEDAQNLTSENKKTPNPTVAQAAPVEEPQPQLQTRETPQAVDEPAPQSPQVIAQATPPPAPQQTQPEPASTPNPAPAQTPTQLPQTGSELPLLGLIGGLALLAYGMTYARNRA
jgi:LPXTG-motif cell wall-anchored protein